MPLTVDQIIEAAMNLSADSEVILAERLLESLANNEPTEIERLWSAESIRRRDEIRSGRVKSVPGDQVMEEVRHLVGR